MANDSDTAWRSDSNEAVQISFIQPGENAPKTLSSFSPQFTYPIFGEEETIFGYKDLVIETLFGAHDLYPHVRISYEEKFKAVGETKPADLIGLLKDYLPGYAFEDTKNFERRIQEDDSSSFKPPGELLHSYSRNGRSYEIWCGELTDPAVSQLLERMQIFVSFFVEAGMPLALDDQEWTLARWRIYFVYEKLPAPPVPKGSVYSFAGYSTSYRFLTYQSIDPNHEVGEISSDNPIPTSSQPCRGRISQFLILPPHQKQGHGSQLYNTMVEAFLKDPACIEITVEDPNESFDDMRDYQDFERLTKNGTFAQIKINPDIDPKLTRRVGSHVPTAKLFDQVNLSKLKANNKIAPRQWNRLVELYLLSKIPKHTREASTSRLTQKAKSADIDDRTFYYWRLLVKQRIYKQHRDVLVTLDSGDRVEKLEATVTSQTDEYLRLLRRIEDEPRPSDSDAPPAATQRAGKRKIIEDDDDDDDDDDDGATGSDPKRLKEAEVEA